MVDHGQGGMPGSGADVEHAFGSARPRKINSELQLVPGLVFAGRVRVRCLLPAVCAACHALSLKRRYRAPA